MNALLAVSEINNVFFLWVIYLICHSDFSLCIISSSFPERPDHGISTKSDLTEYISRLFLCCQYFWICFQWHCLAKIKNWTCALATNVAINFPEQSVLSEDSVVAGKYEYYSFSDHTNLFVNIKHFLMPFEEGKGTSLACLSQWYSNKYHYQWCTHFELSFSRTVSLTSNKLKMSCAQ